MLSGRAPSTVKGRLTHIDRYVGARREDWWDTTSNDLARYLARPEWVSPQTRRTVQGSLAAFFAWATKEGLIEFNPILAVPKVPHSNAHNANAPASRESIRKAIATADDKVAMMIKLAYVAGLKVQEIAVVQRSNVVKDLHGSYSLRAYRGIKFHEVPIPASLADEIRAHDGYLFPGRIQGHISSAYVSKQISAAMPGDETAEQVRLAYRRVLERNVAVDVWRDVANFHSTSNLRLLEYPALASSQDLQRHLDHISRDIGSDPGSAIDHCKKLLESLFKLVLTDLDQPVGDAPKLPALYRSVAMALGLDSEVPESKRASDAVDRAVRSAIGTVQSVAELRNVFDGHGRHEGPQPQPIHARLAFNATVTVAEFVATKWSELRG